MKAETKINGIQFGTPKDLGTTREEYLPKVRQLYRDNARGLFARLSDEELAQGH